MRVEGNSHHVAQRVRAAVACGPTGATGKGMIDEACCMMSRCSGAGMHTARGCCQCSRQASAGCARKTQCSVCHVAGQMRAACTHHTTRVHAVQCLTRGSIVRDGPVMVWRGGEAKVHHLRQQRDGLGFDDGSGCQGESIAWGACGSGYVLQAVAVASSLITAAHVDCRHMGGQQSGPRSAAQPGSQAARQPPTHLDSIHCQAHLVAGAAVSGAPLRAGRVETTGALAHDTQQGGEHAARTCALQRSKWQCMWMWRWWAYRRL